MDNCIIGLIIVYILLIIITYYRKENFVISTAKYEDVPEENNSEETEEGSDNNGKNSELKQKNIYILIFLSKSGPPCKNYDSNIHDKVLDQYKDNNNIIVKKIYNDESPDLFDKYNIEYTPTGYVINDDNGKKEKTNGVLPGQINETVKSVTNN